MNHQVPSFTPSTLRFTRWSRAGYAVFRSLSSAVSIGFLAVSIAESFLKTAFQCFFNQSFISSFDDEEFIDDAFIIAELNELNLNLNSVTIQQSDRVGQSSFSNHSHITVKVGSSLF